MSREKRSIGTQAIDICRKKENIFIQQSISDVIKEVFVASERGEFHTLVDFQKNIEWHQYLPNQKALTKYLSKNGFEGWYITNNEGSRLYVTWGDSLLRKRATKAEYILTQDLEVEESITSIYESPKRRENTKKNKKRESQPIEEQQYSEEDFEDLLFFDEQPIDIDDLNDSDIIGDISFSKSKNKKKTKQTQKEHPKEIQKNSPKEFPKPIKKKDTFEKENPKKENRIEPTKNNSANKSVVKEAPKKVETPKITETIKKLVNPKETDRKSVV